jgi:Sap, sulfolipid-1-addressing protein
MRSFATITPGRSLVTGAMLAAIRPDVLFICIPAGLAIGGSGMDIADDWIAAAFFVAVAASTVAVPVLAYAVAGRRLDATMARLKDWMDKNNAALMAVIFVVIGFMVLYNGVHALHR